MLRNARYEPVRQTIKDSLAGLAVFFLILAVAALDSGTALPAPLTAGASIEGGRMLFPVDGGTGPGVGLLAIMAVLFAAMTALTLGLWRRLRRDYWTAELRARRRR